MLMKNVNFVVLAAGKGTRMKSSVPKVLHKLAGRSMLRHVIDATNAVGESKKVIVTGHGAEQVEEKFESSDTKFVRQEDQLGTAHAVSMAIPELCEDAIVVVLYGDVPLIKENTLKELIDSSNDGISILTTVLDKPFGYGRVRKDRDGNAIAIIEEKDATEDEKNINEIFTGVLCARTDFLKEGLLEIKDDNAAGEFYLTDIVSIMSNKGIKINTYVASNDEVKGANSHRELAELEGIFREMKAQDILDMGITVSDPSRLDVRGEVTSGKDCSIDVNVILEGNVELGDNVSIGLWSDASAAIAISQRGRQLGGLRLRGAAGRPQKRRALSGGQLNFSSSAPRFLP